MLDKDKKAVRDFFCDTGMHVGDLDMGTVIDQLLDEMKKGLAGPSSILMIPSYIDASKHVPVGTATIVLDAGGTNLRSALVSIDTEGQTHISDFNKVRMPGTSGDYVSREEFFDAMAAMVLPLLDKCQWPVIGFCFSYSTQIFPNKDGKLNHWTKEVKAPDVVGRMIGADLKDALCNRGATNIPDVVILNDSVATLLAGKMVKINRPWGGYVGFILGTGANMSYLESNSAITKLTGLNPDGLQIINCESGNFRCDIRGQADIMMEKVTTRPGDQWLEKMTSGGYFGDLCTQTIALAGQKGLFSAQTAEALIDLGRLATKDADNYCHNPFDYAQNPLAGAMKKAGDSDRQRLWFLIDLLLDRAAFLTAAHIAGGILKGPVKKGPLEPVCLTIDGTTFYRNYQMAHRVSGYLGSFLKSKDIYYESLHVDDAPLIGAAVASLTAI